MSEYLATGVKEVSTEVLDRAVRKQRPYPNGNNPVPNPSYDSQIFWFMSQKGDEIAPWGQNIKLRDNQLRLLLPKENVWLSAVSIVASRNAAFSWQISGPNRTVKRAHEILEEVEFGDGWEALIIKTSFDLYTQDNGAFWGLARVDNESPGSPVMGIYNLDSGRCFRTGNKLAPVIYQDIYNKYYLLKWWQVCCFSEIPTPIEGLDGIQYCAFSRLLEALRVRRNILIYDNERTAGRNNQQIHLVQGVTTQQLKDAIAEVRAADDATGLLRYANPVIAGVLDPRATVGHDTIDMRSMPADYDSEEYFKEYMTQVAMALLSDYQEFSPLPGGNLGTSSQSKILHMKNYGKGPGLFRKLITHALNFKVLPRNVEFGFIDQDFEAERSEAEVKFIRARSRAARIASKEILPQVARQLANDDGDLRQEYLAMMGDQDITESTTIQDQSTPESQLKDPEQVEPIEGVEKFNQNIVDPPKPTTAPGNQPSGRQNGNRPGNQAGNKEYEVRKELIYDDNGRIKGVIETHNGG